MRKGFALVSVPGFAGVLAAPANGAAIYNNLTPNNMMTVATRPEPPGVFEIEASDDFVLNSPTLIDKASFVGLLVPCVTGACPSSQTWW
jgi:hypothetical protein